MPLMHAMVHEVPELICIRTGGHELPKAANRALNYV